MKLELSKDDLITLVKTTHPKSLQQAYDLENIGLMRFSGNQWNENWDWNDKELNKMSEEQLFNLYLKYK